MILSDSFWRLPGCKNPVLLRLGDDLPDEVSKEDIQQMLDKADVPWKN